MDCYQWFKDKKFESNSQHAVKTDYKSEDCYQWFKDKKFESNSQLKEQIQCSCHTVISGSKIKSLKAIHNIYT